MSREDQEMLEAKCRTVKWERNSEELALGWLRYEAIRKLNPRQFGEIHARNIAGEHFDTMIDELVTKNITP